MSNTLLFLFTSPIDKSCSGPEHETTLSQDNLEAQDDCSEPRSISGQRTPPNPPLPTEFHPAQAPDTPFNAGPAYDLRRVVGRGAFGCVWAAECRATGRGVAIKRVGGAAADAVAARRLLREMRLLRALGGHANVVRLLDVVASGSGEQARQAGHAATVRRSMRLNCTGQERRSSRESPSFVFSARGGLT